MHYVSLRLVAQGSPPLARGTVVYAKVVIHAIGITPACAGNIARQFRFRQSREDHPRLRGEQIVPLTVARRIAGSPPLARGTEYYAKIESGEERITPACAGNSGKAKLHRIGF